MRRQTASGTRRATRDLGLFELTTVRQCHRLLKLWGLRQSDSYEYTTSFGKHGNAVASKAVGTRTRRCCFFVIIGYVRKWKQPPDSID